MIITIRSVFEEGGKFYPQLLLHDYLYGLNIQKILMVFYNFFYKFLLVYIKINENTDLTYYQRNRDLILNKIKDYYKNNKETLKEQGRDKCKSLSEEEKDEKRIHKE